MGVGRIREAEPVKLIAGMISAEPRLFEEAADILRSRFGETDFISNTLPFDYTDYYKPEMGAGLQRRFYSFARLIPPDSLAAIKIFTNEIEERYSAGNDNKSRRVNIDPGYLCLSRLVLASTKDFYHRVYIGRGIFAEVTLHYQGGNFRHFPWTFPDYKTSEYRQILNKIRSLYAAQIKKGGQVVD